MIYLARFVLCPSLYQIGRRSVSSSAPLCTRGWRVEQGLSVNKNAEGPLIDGPDYTFQDGRPTPLLTKQKLRMLKNRDYARTIVQLNSELEFAIQREQQMKLQAQQERETIVRNRLKPKGDQANK